MKVCIPTADDVTMIDMDEIVMVRTIDHDASRPGIRIQLRNSLSSFEMYFKDDDKRRAVLRVIDDQVGAVHMGDI